jgi:hypothetical protein
MAGLEKESLNLSPFFSMRGHVDIRHTMHKHLNMDYYKWDIEKNEKLIKNIQSSRFL